ncbi:hypothetical protein ES705_26519 [subsurface metagenome]
MNSDKNTPRLLGAAYLIQFVGSILGDSLRSLAIGTGSMSDKLVSISSNLTLMRISILVGLVTSLAIVAMAVLLYVVLHKQNKIIALVALSWWLAEAIILAVSRIEAFALIPLSLEYVQAGAPDPSYFLTLGSLFYESMEFGYAMLMLFFTLGGILWYYLFYRSEYIPRILSVWGLVLLPLMTIDVLLVFLGFSLDLVWRAIILIPYLPFEALIGLWLIVKGIRDDSS